MDDPLLVIDGQFMAYRYWFSMKRLESDERAAAMAFGFFESIRLLKRRYQTNLVAVCFDAKKLKRRDMFPSYKDRSGMTDEERVERERFHREVDAIRTDYLGRVGFQNVFQQEGYEGDDIIAHIASRVKSRPVFIISSDADLYQCLKPNVRHYSPTQQLTMSRRSFQETFGLLPERWPNVKAVAGCPSDKIPGVPGIGEKTALKFFRNELKPESKAYQAITSDDGKATYQRNLKLVRLPLYGVEVPKLKRDRISEKGWKDVCDTLEVSATSENLPAYG